MPVQNSNSERKTKLVGHIFECLSALEQLVQLDQNNADNENNIPDSQSTTEQNTATVGKLVHELVIILLHCKYN
jgi:hypothetical protein